MKNFLKKLHIMSNQAEDTTLEGSTSSRSNKPTDVSSSSPDTSRSHPSNSEHKPFSGLSNWLSSVAQRKSPSPPSSSNVNRMERSDSVSTSGLDTNLDPPRPDSGSSNSRDREVEEEYQIQLALEMSAREDPEAAQIEAVKQISLGSCAPENSPAELVAYRYWNYNSLGYDDKILDGFYDLYGVLNEATSERIPSLVDLQGTPVSDSVTWEAVLVNRGGDANLLKLEQEALDIAVKLKAGAHGFTDGHLVRKLAVLVAGFMGGPVIDPNNMLRAWQSLSQRLKATLGSMVLPLGSLTIGLARHRALLFKVLADGVGIPCRLVKGLQYTGSDDVAMNIVKIDDGREYIVDLMAAPGALIPSDVAGLHIDYDDSLSSVSPGSRDIDSSHIASSSSGIGSSFEERPEVGVPEEQSRLKNISFWNQSDTRTEFRPCPNIPSTAKAPDVSKSTGDSKSHLNLEINRVRELPNRPNYPYTHARSPSWTEGVSSPAARRMKVKDVSQYMIDAAKENPQLAQKLHDVLLESGVVAPPNLFTEVYSESLDSKVEVRSPSDEKQQDLGVGQSKSQNDPRQPQFLPPLPIRARNKPHPSPSQPEESVGINQLLNLSKKVSELANLPQSDTSHIGFGQNVPVAVAAAAVVASSMVVAAAKSNSDSSTVELPMAAAASATAAAVVATAAAVSRQHEQCDGEAGCGGGNTENDVPAANWEGERLSDRSVGNDSVKSDAGLDDVAECEILWEEITLGERIGLGSYGEVYRGDWQGTEVAVKRFLDQDITGESLEEFKSEVRIMKRLRHPNIVLFMGAVTRTPNLSIVTEFLPRGSLYRLIHRPNNQLDERRRLRMALDAARGMHYLHSRNPVIVHRDLKSPNLLVDRNWVVKVCDFGLSRIKHSTYLSSRSTAGTAEWMAPEVLRNEPSDEKCDVYSYGVILWELFTLQQPWGKMNAMQVVGAVGFQHRRLDIPDYIDPVIVDLISRCWETDPRLRPSFAEIMASLKRLQRSVTGAQVPRPPPSASAGTENENQAD